MPIVSKLKNCLTCDKVVRGRSDKKYCDDFCRNSYNNLVKSERNNFMRRVNTILRKNRRIIEAIMDGKEEPTKTNRERMLQLGFQFNSFTHTCLSKKGSTFFFCYEFGYTPLEHDVYLLVKKIAKC